MKKKTKQQHLTKMNKATYRQHSKEFFLRFLVSFVLWLGLFIVMYVNIKPLMEYLKLEAVKNGFSLIYVRVQDVLLQELKLSAIIAFIAALPIILYEFTRFISPVFEKTSAKVIVVMIEIVTILLFSAGVVFSYKIILPFVLSYLSSVGGDIGIQGMVDIKEFIGFYITILFCMGFVFEIPLCMFALTKAKLVTVEQLKGLRRIVIVLSFLIAAIITPPDVVSQCMVAIPMVLLYEVSLIICSVFRNKKDVSVEKADKKPKKKAKVKREKRPKPKKTKCQE